MELYIRARTLYQIAVADLLDSPPCYEFILFVFLGKYKQILIMCLF